MPAAITDVLSELDRLLEPARFQDYCFNGLQVPGPAQVARIATGVSAHAELFELAAREHTDLLIVSMKKVGLSNRDGGAGSGSSRGLVVRSGAHLSIASSSGGPGVIGGRLRGRNSKRAVRRPDDEWRLPEQERRADCW